MKKVKIFIYHLVVFVAGSAGIVFYTFHRLTSLKGSAGLGGIVAMPAIILVYIAAFGILCLISLVIWFLVAHFRRRKN